MRKFKGIFIYIFLMLLCLVGCNMHNVKSELKINTDNLTLQVGDSITIGYSCSEDLKGSLEFISADSLVATIDTNGLITANSVGSTTITLKSGNHSDSMELKVLAKPHNSAIILEASALNGTVGDKITLSTKYLVDGNLVDHNPKYEIIGDNSLASLKDNILTLNKAGKITIRASYLGTFSNIVEIEINNKADKLKITLSAEAINLIEGESTRLSIKTTPNKNISVKYVIDNPKIVSIDNDKLTALAEGSAKVYASYDGIKSNTITFTVAKGHMPAPARLDIFISKDELAKGETATLSFDNHSENASRAINYEIIEGKKNGSIDGNIVTAINGESFSIQGYIGSTRSNIIIVNRAEIKEDPYVNVSPNEFYRSYTKAASYMDSFYRTKHNLMSGSIESQNQAPTEATNKPMKDGRLIRNSEEIFMDNGNTYCIVNSEGEIVNKVYKGGAYIVLEEVAAYVYAFGDAPVNQSKSKDMKPTRSPWGKYLRVNNTYFSGDTSRYPYEPILPNISGEFFEGTRYYEMDLGTTGTDCDPEYPAKPYNNGKSITRGAARIVYTKETHDRNPITNKEDKHVFYTYNHYNDFQEYLNYEGGWGNMFGNITGGGTISSKTDYNPTEYPAVVLGVINSNRIYL